MLTTLYIQNYALIQQLEINFSDGFTVITGETGAGKSILLGALSLLLGKRADTSVLKDNSKKCVVEGYFDISSLKLKTFFSENNLDYQNITVIRREINNNGQSRAFINDTPVTLNLLKELGSRLIDIHSQHQNLILGEFHFQIKTIDSIAQHNKLVEHYSELFQTYKNTQFRLHDLMQLTEKAKSDYDYFLFQFNQLDEAKLFNENEQQDLENELKALTHAHEISSVFNTANNLLEGEGNNILLQLKQITNALDSIRNYFQNAQELIERLKSVYIELSDIAHEIEKSQSQIESNPERIDLINKRLDIIYTLQQKHRVATISELITIRNTLQKQLQQAATYDDEIERLNKLQQQQYNDLKKIAQQISEARKKIIPKFEESVAKVLMQLGMPHANFRVEITSTDTLTKYGCDQINFMFSANKNIAPEEISSVASGGELSRLMLTIKSLVAQSVALPTILFDEVDTGVSGDIAACVGDIMRSIAKHIQVISITHLPQIASKGKHHFLVYKKEDDTTYTNIKKLNNEERVLEIAKMLSGKKITDAAFNNARELLKN